MEASIAAATTGPASTVDTCSKSLENSKLVIATRLHLGKASAPPEDSKLLGILSGFNDMVCNAEKMFGKNCNVNAVIAVDASPNPKMVGYDYVKAIKKRLIDLEASTTTTDCTKIQVLPVTPWGSFVPALNALVLYANGVLKADLIMFVSAEVNASSESIQILCDHVLQDKNTLVAGACLNGHQHAISMSDSGSEETVKEVELNGRTCPWNTLAVWDVRKLSITGFSLCSDLGTFAGVEECAAVAIYQKLFPNSNAKLVRIDAIKWNDDFSGDPERQKWHEAKMKSKLERAQKQLELLNLVGQGTVLHITSSNT